MLEVFYFSDRQVQARLFDCVRSVRGLLLVCGLKHPKGSGDIHQREPFAMLERRFGDLFTAALVVDEGTPEGMWRDPLGALGEHLFPDDRARAYAAANHYLLLEEGRALKIVKKTGNPATDLRVLQNALSALDVAIPPYGGPPGKFDEAAAEEEITEPTGHSAWRESPRPPPPSSRPPEPPRAPVAPAADPWALLGLTPEAPRAEARKAFRVLIAQYHPDKVSHLAPEFRELAEKKTRELLDAWAQVESKLGA